jgi:hypothetical protein
LPQLALPEVQGPRVSRMADAGNDSFILTGSVQITVLGHNVTGTMAADNKGMAACGKYGSHEAGFEDWRRYRLCLHLSAPWRRPGRHRGRARASAALPEPQSPPAGPWGRYVGAKTRKRCHGRSYQDLN